MIGESTEAQQASKPFFASLAERAGRWDIRNALVAAFNAFPSARLECFDEGPNQDYESAIDAELFIYERTTLPALWVESLCRAMHVEPFRTGSDLVHVGEEGLLYSMLRRQSNDFDGRPRYRYALATVLRLSLSDFLRDVRRRLRILIKKQASGGAAQLSVVVQPALS